MEKVIFDPKDKERVSVQDVERLKNSLNKKQISITHFTMIMDSLEKRGEICKIDEIEEAGDMLLDFERA